MSVLETGRASAHPRRRLRLVLGVSTLGVAGVALMASSELHGLPHAAPSAKVELARPAPAAFRLADDASRDGSANAAGTLGAVAKGSPEDRLLGVYKAIGAGQGDQALGAAAALVHDVPGFKLAQLVYADLLATRAGAAPRMAASSAVTPASGPQAEVALLRDEAQLRLRALQERPPEGLVPAEFVVLPKAVHHAILVDTSRARLYLFQNTPQGMRLVSDHYISVGKQGVDKSVEGDQRTPLGVYFVSDRVAQGALEPRFGAGALQLNYPNAYDKVRGRTGSGIYVHGVPASTYSRPPRDSDGCVAMSNEELVALMQRIPLHDTPVIITRQAHWGAAKAAQVERARILDAVNEWQSARSRGDDALLDRFYAPGVHTTPLPPAPPMAIPAGAKARKGAAVAAQPARPQPALPPVFSDLSVLTWADDAAPMMVVTFHERPPHGRDNTRRQYWALKDQRWHIVAEGLVR